MKTILFVCQGNIFRSPVAEALLNKRLSELGLSDSVIAISRGIQGQAGISNPKYKRLDLYENEYLLAEPVLKENNIDISKHESKPVDLETLQNADLIIALGENILNGTGGLNSFGDEIVKKTIVSEIPDPAEELSLNKYEVVVPRLVSAIDQLTPQIISFLADKETKRENEFPSLREFRK